jgi:hypothetical protein
LKFKWRKKGIETERRVVISARYTGWGYFEGGKRDCQGSGSPPD